MLVVTNENDSGQGSLRHVISNSCNSTVIRIDPSCTKITLLSPIRCFHNITIVSNGVVIHAIHKHDFAFYSSTISFYNCTFKGSDCGLVHANSVRLDKCRIDGWMSLNDIIFTKSLSMYDCVFNNLRSDSGSCIVSLDDMVMTGCLFRQSYGYKALVDCAAENIELVYNSFNGNMSRGSICNLRAKSIKDENNIYCQNNAKKHIVLQESLVANCDTNYFTENISGADGIKIAVQQSIICNCHIENNTILNGSALFIEGLSTNISNTQIIKNQVFASTDINSAGIFLQVDKSKLEDCSIDKNSGPGVGGVYVNGFIELIDVDITNNVGTYGGLSTCMDTRLDTCNVVNNYVDFTKRLELNVHRV